MMSLTRIFSVMLDPLKMSKKLATATDEFSATGSFASCYDSDDGIDSAITICQCGEETCGACMMAKGNDLRDLPRRYQNWQEVLEFCEKELMEKLPFGITKAR